MYLPIWVIIVIAIALVWYFRNARQKDGFSPLRIHIMPNWEEIIKDYKLAKDDSFWKKVPNSANYHVLRNGINFTVLNTDLIYRDDWHSFHTEVDFKQKIEELSVGLDFIGFSVKWGVEGYEVGLRTPESAKNSHHFSDEEDIIKIATIPYSELGLYRFAKAKKVLRDQMLEKYDWTRDEPDAEFSLVDPTVELKHKYCTVYFRYI